MLQFYHEVKVIEIYFSINLEVLSIKNCSKKDSIVMASGLFFIVFFVKLIKDLNDLSVLNLVASILLATIFAVIFFILKYPFNSK